jgi:hypothetical protein
VDARERYIETLTFGSPDRIPFDPGYPRESTLRAWHSQGLSDGCPWFDALCDAVGMDAPPSAGHAEPGVDLRMRPRFEEKVLEHRDGHYIVQDWIGNVVEISDEYDFSYIRTARDFVTRRWLRFPVAGRDGFEEMKERYDSRDPGRYPRDFEQRCRALAEGGCIVSLVVPGPFWQMREWCGFEPLCLSFIDDPELLGEMCAFWAQFVSEVIGPALAAGVVDRVQVSEDMAYKEKPMVSPAMAREFLQPVYARWVRQAERAGVQIVDMDCDGKIGLLAPIWAESGINVCSPVEVAAGNDLAALRAELGRSMAYRGGIDKRCIAAGGGRMVAEIERVAPVAEDGGYIPGCDHGVPPDVSWPAFVRYGRLLAGLTGWV